MASTYLSKTFGSAGNRKKFTISVWVKRTGLGSVQQIMAVGTYSSTLLDQLYFNSTDTLNFDNVNTSGTATSTFISNAKFRDTSAWYHIVVKVDSTQASAGDRVKFYVNGSEISLATETQPAQNYDFAFNNNVLHNIGTRPGQSHYFDGLMSHFHFTDGYAYDASTFGSTDSTTGEWKINTSPSITMGTNGFTILKDANTITDQSSNSNDWSVGAGTVSNTEDCPSNVFCTINALNTQISGLTIGNGNTSRSSNTGDAWRTTYGTLAASSGKFYWEQKVTGSVGSAHYIGITDQDENRHSNTNDFENANVSAYCYRGDGGKVTSVSGSTVLTASAGASFTNGDIIGVAMDLDNQKIYFSKNGTWQASGDPTSGSTGTGSFFNITAGKLYTPATACYHSGAGYQYNFGNGSFGGTAISSEGTNASSIGKFEYDVPTGYTALSTKGLNE